MLAVNTAIGTTALWVTVDLLIAVVGLFLPYVGWSPAPSRPVSQADTSTPDIPRAA